MHVVLKTFMRKLRKLKTYWWK